LLKSFFPEPFTVAISTQTVIIANCSKGRTKVGGVCRKDSKIIEGNKKQNKDEENNSIEH
jgi:hypothetical protein